MDEMIALSERIAADHLRMTVEWADHNPYMEDMGAGSSHWKCTLRNGRKRMTVYFSTGSALRGEPTLADVLDCLLSDASGFENARNFEEWAGDYGYDADSRKAERTFKVVERQACKLRQFLNSHYDDYLWRTERL